jgi:predicted esterase
VPAKVSCPGCGQQFAAPDHLYGKVVGCPSCQTQIQIPIPQAKSLEPDPLQPDPLQPDPLQPVDPLAAPQNPDPLAPQQTAAAPSMAKSSTTSSSGSSGGTPAWVWIAIAGGGGAVALLVIVSVIVSMFWSNGTTEGPDPPVVATGNGKGETPEVSDEDRERQRKLEEENAAVGRKRARYFVASGPEWAVSVIEPRSAVTPAEFDIIIQQRVNARPVPEDVLAEQETIAADRLATAGTTDLAETQYASITTKYPTFARAHYQRAVNLITLGKTDEAKTSFNSAMSNGYWDFPTMKEGKGLKEIRNESTYQTQLRKVKTAYEQRMTNLRGTPVIVLPSDVSKASPCVVLLHGFADSNRTFVEPAKAWAELGFVAIALPGPVPYDKSYRFTWSNTSIDATHADIQSVVGQEQIAPYVDNSKVNLVGFSQGALHACQLLMKRPESYAGSVAISPNGQPWVIDSVPELDPTRPRKYWFVHGEQETSLAAVVARWQQGVDEAGWKLKSSTHAGGHEIPGDWATTRREVGEFLME